MPLLALRSMQHHYANRGVVRVMMTALRAQRRRCLRLVQLWLVTKTTTVKKRGPQPPWVQFCNELIGSKSIEFHAQRVAPVNSETLNTRRAACCHLLQGLVTPLAFRPLV
jgi:hypothetical protein